MHEEDEGGSPGVMVVGIRDETGSTGATGILIGSLPQW